MRLIRLPKSSASRLIIPRYQGGSPRCRKSRWARRRNRNPRDHRNLSKIMCPHTPDVTNCGVPAESLCFELLTCESHATRTLEIWARKIFLARDRGRIEVRKAIGHPSRLFEFRQQDKRAAWHHLQISWTSCLSRAFLASRLRPKTFRLLRGYPRHPLKGINHNVPAFWYHSTEAFFE